MIQTTADAEIRFGEEALAHPAGTVASALGEVMVLLTKWHFNICGDM
jgi:hypothetical protein